MKAGLAEKFGRDELREPGWFAIPVIAPGDTPGSVGEECPLARGESGSARRRERTTRPLIGLRMGIPVRNALAISSAPRAHFRLAKLGHEARMVFAFMALPAIPCGKTQSVREADMLSQNRDFAPAPRVDYRRRSDKLSPRTGKRPHCGGQLPDRSGTQSVLPSSLPHSNSRALP